MLKLLSKKFYAIFYSFAGEIVQGVVVMFEITKPEAKGQTQLTTRSLLIVNSTK